MDVEHRWNSTYDLLVSALRITKSLTALSDNILREKKVDFNIDYITDEFKYEQNLLIENYNKLSYRSLKENKYNDKLKYMLKRKIIL